MKQSQGQKKEASDDHQNKQNRQNPEIRVERQSKQVKVGIPR